MATPKRPKGSDFIYQKTRLGSSPVHPQNPDFSDFWPFLTILAIPGRPPKTPKNRPKPRKMTPETLKNDPVLDPDFHEISEFFLKISQYLHISIKNIQLT
jgi:hypothetical protein